jgi:hypothetical protein
MTVMTAILVVVTMMMLMMMMMMWLMVMMMMMMTTTTMMLTMKMVKINDNIGDNKDDRHLLFQYAIVECRTKAGSAQSEAGSGEPGLFDFVHFAGQVSCRSCSSLRFCITISQLCYMKEIVDYYDNLALLFTSFCPSCV